MIVGLGIDLTELSRIQRLWERYKESFARKILHEQELAIMPKHPVSYLASRFAAKEAAVKALGTGFIKGIWFSDVYVNKLPSGQPEIVFTGQALERMKKLGATKAHITITHSKDTAAAVVVLEN